MPDPSRRLLRCSFASVLVSLLTGCPGPPADGLVKQAVLVASDEPRAQRDAPQIEVALHGCKVHAAAEDGGAICLLAKPRTLHLAVPDDAGEVDLRLNGEPLASERFAAGGLTILRVRPGVTTGVLELASGSARVRFAPVELRPLTPAYLEQRRQLRAQADEPPAAGREPLASPLERAALDCHREELAFLAGETSGRERGRQARARADQRPTVLDCAGKAHLQAAFELLATELDFAAAGDQLRAGRRLAARDLRTRLGTRYLEGMLAFKLGRLDEAVEAFAEVGRLAELIGDRTYAHAARAEQAATLTHLGRFDEAAALVDTVAGKVGDSDGSDARFVDEVRHAMAWAGLWRREVDGSAADPSPQLRALAQRYQARGELDSLAAARLDLALAALQSGRAQAAGRELAAIDRGALEPADLIWYELVASRQALAVGALARAGVHLERAASYAELSEDRAHAFRVWSQRARLERSAGNSEAALAAYARARELADDLALAVPIASGRSLLATRQSHVDAEAIELLIATGRTREAFCQAASVRARHLRAAWARLRPPLSADDEAQYRELLARHAQRRRALEQQREQLWQLSEAELAQLRARRRDADARADELLEAAIEVLERHAPQWQCERIEPSPGELVLTMAPATGPGQWQLFAATGDGQLHLRRAAVSEGQAAAALADFLGELAAPLAAATRLRVLPVGPFVEVDVAVELPASAASLEVVYGLGLGSARVHPLDRDPAATVLSGSDNLPAAAREVERVAAALAGEGWRLSEGWPGGGERPTLVHYAGHGRHAGIAGAASYLELPEGRLSAAQIIAAQRAPAIVVLGACEAGMGDPRAIDGGVNLVTAFLLAGAQLVVAPTRAIEDETALELATGLYRELPPQRAADGLIAALTQLQRSQDPAVAPAASFRSWRAWVP